MISSLCCCTLRACNTFFRSLCVCCVRFLLSSMNLAYEYLKCEYVCVCCGCVVPVYLCKCSTCFELNGCCFYKYCVRCHPHPPFAASAQGSIASSLFVYCSCILDFMNNSFANACKVIVCTTHEITAHSMTNYRVFRYTGSSSSFAMRWMMQMICTCNMNSANLTHSLIQLGCMSARCLHFLPSLN